MLTISKLKRWSINYYIDTAQTAEKATRDLSRASGGLGEYYSEHETRTATWLLAGDTHGVAKLVGLTDIQRAGGHADATVVARWLDDGITPNGAHGRTFGQRGVHGFDVEGKDYAFERKLNARHGASRFCPICKTLRG